ncbi:MAG TPA: hypothetical protein VFP98_01310, partial [Candidatus Polarisedimenticolia bacterium]|nr:hypothetical protein [Candidatus Polarisedimenticolia bacterium]
GRQLRLRGKVQRCSETPSHPGFLLCLLDGPFESIEQLRELVGRLKSGALLEEISPDQPPEQRIRAMAPSLRAMLAARATAEERAVLARDTDPRVVDGLLKNPSITMEEV